MNLVLVIMNSTATLGGVYCLDYLHIALENDIYPLVYFLQTTYTGLVTGNVHLGQLIL